MAQMYAEMHNVEAELGHFREALQSGENSKVLRKIYALNSEQLK